MPSGRNSLLLAVALGLLAVVSPVTLRVAAAGLARLAVVVGAAAAIAFGVTGVLLPAIPAACLGVVLYSALVLALRSHGLAEGWTYVRGLH